MTRGLTIQEEKNERPSQFFLNGLGKELERHSSDGIASAVRPTPATK